MDVFFDSWSEDYKKPYGALPISSKVHFFIKTSGVKNAFLRIWDDIEGESILDMKKNQDGFELDIKLPDSARLLWYHFVLKSENDDVMYYGNNYNKYGGIGTLSFDIPKDYQQTVYKSQNLPSWYKECISYQIFPDRFSRDKDSSKRALSQNINLVPWDKKPSYEKDENGDVIKWDFYGGSLRGIKENLVYLKSLGIGLIYLNPIFKAKSNHRYDTYDFFKIDPLLGNENDFIELCQCAKKFDIRIILDGVFSHVGKDSIYFKEGSKYQRWFKFDDSEIGYKCWWGVKDLPEINELDESYISYICGEGGVIDHYLKLGASGFRLDVADELPDYFIKKVRQAIKKHGDDYLLIGEVWEDASCKESYGEKRRYILDDELDAVMNYPLRKISIDFLNGYIDSITFKNEFLSLKEHYPPSIFYGSFNIISSHDRERITTVFNKNDKKVRAIYSLYYCIVGVPVIYYGDEALLEGSTDPENRGTFCLDDSVNSYMFYYLRMLKNIYNENDVLKNGQIQFCNNDNSDLISFIRYDNSQTILYVMNRNPNITHSFTYNTDFNYALNLLTSIEIKINNNSLNIDVGPLESFIILLKNIKNNSISAKRRAGLLCPLFSIPGGKLGDGAKKFIDWLSDAGFTLWQVLPINKTDENLSPYLCDDVLSLNYNFIDYSSVSPKEKDLNKVFNKQWSEMKEYANKKNIEIIGDIPIYFNPSKSYLKEHSDMFYTDKEYNTELRAGVPPDYFQKEGQDWGNPVYNWDNMKKDSFKWWVERLKFISPFFDYIRLDHFRSFSEFYAIEKNKSPKEGKWLKGPGLKFFDVVKKQIPDIKFIAEDLGFLDPSVYNLVKLSNIPGMNIWQFSADEMKNMNKEDARKRIFYSGTHDNNTLYEWCKRDEEKTKEIIEELISSNATWVILQLQDILLLDDKSRINIPGTTANNWVWECEKKYLTQTCAEWIRSLIEKYNRT